MKRLADKGKMTNAKFVANRKALVERTSYNSGIGDILANKFASIGLKAVKGCKCKQTQNILNGVRPEQILQNIEHWAVVLRRSARSWKENKGGIWKIVPTPPLTVFKQFIKDAAEEAQKEVA